MQLEPLIFIPKLSPRIWGGSRLASYGKPLVEGQPIGESWEIYDRPGDSAVVASGAFQGQTLAALMAEFGPALLGQKAFERGAAYFPLMVKLIDARQALSVQVHPDDDQAARMVSPDELGKTEMWVVLEAEAGARMTAGLKQGCSPELLRKALGEGHLEGLLNEFPVKAGDVIFVPAGRVHAIGAGCLVAEIQQNSDTTWRVYDYGRLENGKPRELHIEQAMRCIRFDEAMQSLPPLSQPQPRGEGESLLLECEYFSVSRLDLQGRFRPRLGEPVFHLLSALEGATKISYAAGEIELRRGQTALLPASLSWELAPIARQASLLWSRP